MSSTQEVKTMTLRARIFWSSALVLLILSIVLSGLNVVDRAHLARELYQQIDTTQQRQDKLLADHSRLLLERGAITSMQNIEQIAESELGMEFPDHIAQVLK